MTNQRETLNKKDLIVRKDGLFYKKHAKKPFTGIGEDFLDNGAVAVTDYKDGKIEGLVEGFHETLKENVCEALKLLGATFDYWDTWDTLNRGEHPLKNCSKKFTSNKEFMLEAIKIDVDNLEYASNAVKQDKEVLLAALRQDPFYFEKIPEELKTDNIFFDTAKEYFLEMLRGERHFDDRYDQYEDFHVYWMDNYSIEEDFAMFGNDKDVALEILAANPSCYIFDFLEFLGPKLNEDEDFMEDIYFRVGSYIVSEYTVSEYDGSIDDFFEQYKSKEFISPRHLSRITEIIGPLELQTKSWKEQKEKDQERQTRIKEEAKKLKSSQGELF